MDKHVTTPRDLLARAFLDMLAADAGTNGSPMLRSGNPNDPIEHLIQDLSTAPESPGRTSIRADLAAVAILVARAIEAVEELTRDLRRRNPVVVLATHGAEVLSLVQEVLETCAFGNECHVHDERNFDATRYTRPVLLLVRDGTASDHKPERGNEIIARALHAGAPVFGAAPDPRRHLPRDLLRASEHDLSLGQLDASAIALVIEAVTGKRPNIDIDDQLVRAVDISDLALSIRAGRSADDCVRRLETIVSNKSVFDHRGPSLEELSGYGAAREWGLNLISDFREYKAGRLHWDCIEKGLLLAGPPGVGKTSFAKALAKSANVPLVSTSVADWNAASFLSGTLSAIKLSFTKARQLAPCILLVDELDGISDRSKLLKSEYREYWTQIVNLLLEQLAGVEERPGVVVIGATNHPDHIDPAIRRAGRLDRTIELGLPDAESLAAIFRFHLGADLRDIDLIPVALAAAGRTGADVEAWVRRAKSHARRARRSVTMDDLLHEVRSGRAVLPENLRRACAIHEAGHLIVGVALEVFRPKALSILDDGGATQFELSRANAQTERGIENFITALVAGRAAEEVVLGSSEATAGAGVGSQSDFARATNAAVDLELRFGFGAIGVACFSDPITDLLLQDASILRRVKERLDRCLSRARGLIQQNFETVKAAASRLEATGYLDRSSIDDLLKKWPIKA